MFESASSEPATIARYRGIAIFVVAFAVLWLASPLLRYIPEFPPDPIVVRSESANLRVVTMTTRLNRPWGLAFLPNGDMLVTELPGRLRLVHSGTLLPYVIGGLPRVETRDQAGLMDIALHPRFSENGLIYFTYSKIGPRGNTPALACARFDGQRLIDFHDVFVTDAWSNQTGGNTGSRIVFGLDGKVYMSVGDRHEQTPAQDMHNDKGKVLRLNDDGSIPEDNPFLTRLDIRPEIFVSGVRNPQGLFLDRATGILWENEHGPQGGDEVNILLPGHNYGWPVITYGKNYDGTIITLEHFRAGMDQPLVYWVPSIAPSGMTIYRGDKFPAWNGNVFVGALAGQHLRRIVFEDGQPPHEEQLFHSLHQRIRDVREGPDGFLYVLTDSSRLLRIEPMK
jgi:glucose/arabinose dehydrogenase